jgi:hypothetical protein
VQNLELVGVEPTRDVYRRNRLRWFGHAERKWDDDWVKKCTKMEVEGNRPRGRPRKTWMKTLEDDMSVVLCSQRMKRRTDRGL